MKNILDDFATITQDASVSGDDDDGGGDDDDDGGGGGGDDDLFVAFIHRGPGALHRGRHVIKK